jgi:hypothetical protein
MKETDIIAEMKGDSPLEDEPGHVKKDFEKIRIKQYASITSAKSVNKKNEITIKIENNHEKLRKAELSKNKSNKTISIENQKSEVTRSSPNSKKIENTLK